MVQRLSPLEGLRVLHVLGELQPSGAEVMLRVAAPYFRTYGICCEILTTGEDGVGPYAGSLENAGYVIHHLPYSRRFDFFWKLRKIAIEGSFDIVHIHFEAATLYIAASLMDSTRIVRTVHNNFVFTGWLRARRTLTRMLSRALGVRHVAISPSVQATELKCFSNPTDLCLNWYDNELYRPPTRAERVEARNSFGLANSDLAIVSVGNCSTVKNHMAIIDALGRLRQYPHMIYLHAGHETKLAEEREQAARLGIGGQVRFLGALPDVRSLLHAADLFVMPSLVEGAPISLMEALGCGVPALLANSPGLKEFSAWFPDLLYCEQDGSDLADRLQVFAEMSPQERSAFASDLSEKAKQTFGVDEGVTAYLSAYDRLLNGPKTSEPVSIELSGPTVP